MTKDEALRIAIEVMQRYLKETPLGNQPHMIAHKAEEAIQACKDALAQPAECKHDWVSAKNKFVQNGSICLKCFAIDAKEPDVLNAEAGLKEGKAETQKPVATVSICAETNLINVHWLNVPKDKALLYTTPPSREWVGLSDSEKVIIAFDKTMPIEAAIAVTEAKLKEKNELFGNSR